MFQHKNVNYQVNNTLLNLETYATKAVSMHAKRDPEIVDLSFGEPEFGPPGYLLEAIKSSELTIESFLDSVKRYEDPKGSLELRTAISLWYKRRYGFEINPETEIMITHGGVEAITLAILCTSEIGDTILVTDPSYMLYKRTIMALGRSSISLRRSTEDYEYVNIFEDTNVRHSVLNKAKSIIINSPENPSGYVVDKEEWELIGNYANKSNFWIIHDEVYDSMAFERKHIPCKSINGLSKHSILINSFSKKFGVPGLRIGWMVANEDMINLASKIHDYLYLGVNILSEKIAMRIISDAKNDQWLADIAKSLQQRAHKAMIELSEREGFIWTRKPLGAMFLFPNVCKLYENIPEFYKLNSVSVGDAVARYLLKEKKVAVVPGSIYGTEGNDHIRLVLCTKDKEFNLALDRLKS